jgi:hypothetical protein
MKMGSSELNIEINIIGKVLFDYRSISLLLDEKWLNNDGFSY